MKKALFFDTYALFEIVEGNRDYGPYTKDIAVVTTKMNLMELYYGLLSRFSKQTAEACYNEFRKSAVETDDEIIKRACEFRALFRSRNLSFIDCLGYMTAILNNLKFLTGDIQFKDLPGVEFVR